MDTWIDERTAACMNRWTDARMDGWMATEIGPQTGFWSKVKPMTMPVWAPSVTSSPKMATVEAKFAL